MWVPCIYILWKYKYYIIFHRSISTKMTSKNPISIISSHCFQTKLCIGPTLGIMASLIDPHLMCIPLKIKVNYKNMINQENVEWNKISIHYYNLNDFAYVLTILTVLWISETCLAIQSNNIKALSRHNPTLKKTISLCYCFRHFPIIIFNWINVWNDVKSIKIWYCIKAPFIWYKMCLITFQLFYIVSVYHD